MLEELVQARGTPKSPLWSTQQVLDNPEAVVAAHLGFLRAGARIIMTSTYQASVETFKRAGYSEDKAKRTYLEGVRLADKARAAFVSETDEPSVIVKIALSLGPFGATLFPPQEFNGYYPPPYGPAGYLDKEPRYNSFDKDDAEAEQKSIDALAQFHLDRLLVYARDPKTWRMIDIVAFETIPLVREVKAIRKAVASLQNALAAEGVDLVPKPWWISFVLPTGKCPETEFPGGPNLTVRDLVSAALIWTPTSGMASTSGPMATPTGVGINCTAPGLIHGLVQDMSEAVEQMRDSPQHAPWLVLYPDGGDVYDILTRSWVVASDDRRATWAADLKQTVCEVSQRFPSVWGGIVVGGCCRTGPDQIRRLKEQLFPTS
ncbi:Homocysteine S-methyltransferase [Lyophyllum atratum]|nr:Homocysteine S-methyltransferase [Lyophyllum atratum]